MPFYKQNKFKDTLDLKELNVSYRIAIMQQGMISSLNHNWNELGWEKAGQLKNCNYAAKNY